MQKFVYLHSTQSLSTSQIATRTINCGSKQSTAHDLFRPPTVGALVVWDVEFERVSVKKLEQ